MVKHMREQMGVRVLLYIDDILLTPSVGRAIKREDFVNISGRWVVLLEELGLERQESKDLLGRPAQG